VNSADVDVHGVRRDIRSAHSWLFVPGSRADRFDKAAATDAHVIICDLEDAVDPESKGLARDAVASYLAGGADVVVRINAEATRWYEQDVAALAGIPNLVGVMIPKAEDVRSLTELRNLLGGNTPLIPLIETAVGIDQAKELARLEGVDRLAFGSLDYALDINAAHTDQSLLHARSALVLASRLADKPPPVDGVTTALSDPRPTRTDAKAARSLGFGGKLCIHPAQVAAVNDAFMPTPVEIAWALQVVERAVTSGAARLDGVMIDRPVIERARRMLRAVGQSPPDRE
jgi:citrate lyase subunit beta / citryl-CoA lyase